MSREPGLIKCKRLVLKSSAIKHILLSRPLTCFLFPLQCFLCDSGAPVCQGAQILEHPLDPDFGARQCRVLEGSCSKCQSCSLLPAGLGVEEWAQRPQEDLWGRGCVITASRIGLQMVLLEEEALQTGEGTSTGSCRAQLSMGHCTCPSPVPAPRGKAQNLGTCQCHEVVPS